jgi:hypothetical protein
LRLFNIYNQPERLQLSAVARLLSLIIGDNNELVLGDFNLHHPMWGGPNIDADGATDGLINNLEEPRFGLWLPPGMITQRAANSHTTIDLVWGSHELSRRRFTAALTR